MVYPPATPPTPSPTLNAIPPLYAEDPEATVERIARHLRVCQELIEIGMRLVRAAADHAEDDMAAPPPVAAIPGSSAGVIAQAEERARRRSPNYGRLVTHLSRAIRQAVLLETHIAQGRLVRPDRAAPHLSEIHGADPDAAPRPPRHESLEPLDDFCDHDDARSLDLEGETGIDTHLQTIAEKFGFLTDLPPTQGNRLAPETPAPAEPHPAQPRLEPQKPAAIKTSRRW